MARTIDNWTDPEWMAVARGYIGERETIGPNDSHFIRKMLQKLNGSWLLGQPWCGGFVAHVMDECDIERPKHWYRAKAWADWGVKLDRPAPGCVVVFERKGGGHVGFVTGEDPTGRILCLGGNQGDAVNIRAFMRDRVIAYRWPSGRDMPRYVELAQAWAPETTGEA